jgi:hypothetical protein
MKKIGKESIIKVLRYAIDFALVLQFIGLIFGVVTIIVLLTKGPSGIVTNNDSHFATMSSGIGNVMIALQNPNLGEHIEFIGYRFHMFILLYGFMLVIALMLITFQLRFIFKSFSHEGYFDQSNPRRINRIAIIIFIWVIADYALRFIPQIIIPDYFISSSVGLNSFSHGGHFGLFGFDLKMLTVSIIIYMLAIVYKLGNNLKEESSLTI